MYGASCISKQYPHTSGLLFLSNKDYYDALSQSINIDHYDDHETFLALNKISTGITLQKCAHFITNENEGDAWRQYLLKGKASDLSFEARFVVSEEPYRVVEFEPYVCYQVMHHLERLLVAYGVWLF